jgi:hypothetical protein
MSRFLQGIAPVLKLALVVVIIAAWVEANAKRIHSESAPSPAPSVAAPPAEPAKGDCSPAIDRGNVRRIVPARPAVIRT